MFFRNCFVSANIWGHGNSRDIDANLDYIYAHEAYVHALSQPYNSSTRYTGFVEVDLAQIWEGASMQSTEASCQIERGQTMTQNL